MKTESATVKTPRRPSLGSPSQAGGDGLPGTPRPLAGRCGAKLRQSVERWGVERYCARGTLQNGRCRFHGGGSPVGPANGNFVHGGRSKYVGAISAALVERYEQFSRAVTPSTLAELGLLDTRVYEVLESISRKDLVRIAADARDAINELDTAVAAGDDCTTHIAAIREYFTETAASAAGWDEIRKTLAQRAELSKVEITYQRMIADKIMLEHVDAFVRALIGEARTLSTDRAALTRYVQRVQALGQSLIGQAVAQLPEMQPSIDVDAHEVEP